MNSKSINNLILHKTNNVATDYVIAENNAQFTDSLNNALGSYGGYVDRASCSLRFKNNQAA